MKPPHSSAASGVTAMLIPDDPIIRSMERTGYPPWYAPREVFHPFMLCYEEDEEWEEDDVREEEEED